MVLGFTWLDALLVLGLVLLVGHGHRRGLWVVLGNLVGVAVGAVIAFFALPVVAQWSAGAPWRWAVLAATVVLLLASGQYIGAAVGEAVRLRVGSPALRRVDHLLGAVATVLVASLMAGFVAFSADSLGSAPVAREVARSRVLTAIDALMPDPLLSWAARARTAVVELDGIPELRLPAPSPAPPSESAAAQAGAAGTPAAPVSPESSAASAATEAVPTPASPGADGEGAASPTDPAEVPTSTRPPARSQTPAPATSSAPEADAAASSAAPDAEEEAEETEETTASPSPTRSKARTSAPASTPTRAPASSAPSAVPAADAVVRVTGTADSCAQVQSGSGVAVAPDRVLTNAHVVAGVPAPTVVDRERGVYEARVLLLDTARDLAILAVDGAELPAARLGSELGVGAAAEVMGYPDGGPFARIPATVSAKGEVPLQDVSSSAVSSVDVYTLAAAVRHGFSGGPVVAADGSLVGLVFARAPGDTGTGYALTADTIASAVRQASALTATTSAGQCTPGG